MTAKTAKKPAAKKANLSSHLPNGLSSETAPEPGYVPQATQMMNELDAEATAKMEGRELSQEEKDLGIEYGKPFKMEGGAAGLADAVKAAGADPQAVDDLMAELERARMELADLKKSKPAAKTMTLSPKSLKRREWQKTMLDIEDEAREAAAGEVYGSPLDDEETLLGRAQRLGRDHLLVSTFKAVRALKWRQLPEVFVYLLTKAAEGGGASGEETIEGLYEEFTSKREPKAKATEG